MDPNECSGLSSYFQPQQPPPPPPSSSLNLGAGATVSAIPVTTTTGAATTQNTSPTNGILSNNPTGTATTPNTTATTTSSSPMVYPHSVPSAVSTGGGAGGLETVKRKRGRPRKYGTPEQAAAAKRLSSSASSSAPISSSKRKDHAFSSAGASSSSKKFQIGSLGNPGQSFTPHVISVAAGEDVGQKIMMFTQQIKREICILSASGSISNASLRQPATSGGNITYEGRFDILSLSGSFVRNELGGKTGGLSVCLASTDGQIIGGGVGGPLKAAGPIQVIVGTFLLDNKKDVTAAVKGDASAGKLPSPIAGASFSGVSLGSPIDSYQNIGGSQFMIQPRGTHFAAAQSMEWRDHSGNDVQQSPENGNYEHIPDLRS